MSKQKNVSKDVAYLNIFATCIFPL